MCPIHICKHIYGLGLGAGIFVAILYLCTLKHQDSRPTFGQINLKFAETGSVKCMGLALCHDNTMKTRLER